MPATAESKVDPRRTVMLATLRRSRIFSSLPPKDLELVADGCQIRTLQKGEMLFREGAVSDGFFVAQTGQISIFRVTPDGREQIICVFQPPESFAEVTLATVETYPANAIALEPAQVILVRKQEFRDLIRRKPELSLHMLGSMSLHLKHLVQTIQNYKGRQIENRLADWLLRRLPPGTASFELSVTKKTLAGELGVTSETLSRTFARFRDENLIRVEGPCIHVLDPQGLAAYAAC